MPEQPRTREIHELKTWPEFFQPTLNGKKKFELRRNDRDYRVGDELVLKEWDPMVCDTHFSHTSNQEGAIQAAYTGREVTVQVNYIMDFLTMDRLLEYPGIESPGYIIMSVSLIP